MNETRGMIHPVARFLSSCDPVKQAMCFQNTMVGEAWYYQTFQLQKGEIGRKKEMMGPK